MAHHIVRLTDHFLARVGADLAKGFVGLGNHAFQVSSRIDEFVFREQHFAIRNRGVIAHYCSSSAKPGPWQPVIKDGSRPTRDG
jgi:hypothetical protein